MLESTLGKLVTIIRYHGSMSTTEREDSQFRINDDPEPCILLLSTMCGGVGLNLQGAEAMIVVDHTWNPMAEEQVVARINRIGQLKACYVYRLVYKETVEEKVIRLHVDKLDVARQNVPDLSTYQEKDRKL